MAIISDNLSIITFAQVTNINSSFSTYENSTYGITIKYPNGWDIDESGGIHGTDINIVTFSSPNQTDSAIVNLHQDKQDNIGSNMTNFLKSELSYYKNNLRDFQIGTISNNLLAGNNGYKMLFTYTDNNGSKMKDMEVGTVIGDKAYYIIYDVKESLFNNYLPIIQTMLNSFNVIPKVN